MNTEAMKLERRTREWDKAECVHALISTGMPVKMAAGASWRHADPDPMIEVRRCLYCKVLLPLGPATDTRDTDIEILAAEIAVMTDEEREKVLNIEQQFAFGDGFDSTLTDRVETAFPGAIRYGAGEQAAWLAAQIIQHELADWPMPASAQPEETP